MESKYYTKKSKPQPVKEEVDPTVLAREFFGNESRAMTAEGFTAEAREPYIDLICQDSWEEILRNVFIPIVKKLRREMIHRFNLPADQRQRDLGFLFFLAAALHEIYKRAGEEGMPPDLAKEFN
ncbi:MAG: hypothetical protein ACREQ5_12365 [Candidatus Dormibacteria bacterium]